MAKALFELAGAVIGQALRTLVRSLLVMTSVAFVLAGTSFALAFGGSWQRGVLAFLLVLTVGFMAGMVMSVKRAMFGGLAGGLEHQRLGQHTVRLLLSPDGPMGKVVGRLPLADAERQLRLAVDSTVGSMAQLTGVRAGLARMIQERLIRMVEQLTLARFRTDAAAHGGDVDLAQISAELGDRVDMLMLEQVRGAATKLTVLVFLADLALAGLLTFALRQWNP